MSKKTISIRLSEDIHEKLKLLAAEDRRTVSAYIEMLIANKFKSFVAPGVTSMQFYPKVLSEEEIKEIYEK